MPPTTPLDPTMTVNEIVAACPQTMPVFNAFGIDTCCGGGVSLEEAARRDALDVDTVIAAVRKAAEEAR